MIHEDEQLKKELNEILFSRPSLFKEFYDSKRNEGKQHTLLILGYIQSKGVKVPLREITKKLVFHHQRKDIPYLERNLQKVRAYMHETTLHRLLNELVDAGILIKDEDIEITERSKIGKQKKNSFYSISKNAFKRLQYEDPETRKNRLIANRFIELEIAKEIIGECGINADAEIKKRFHERSCVKANDVEPNAVLEIVSFEDFTRNTDNNKSKNVKKDSDEFPKVSFTDFDNDD
jgi:hypothetical protein